MRPHLWENARPAPVPIASPTSAKQLKFFGGKFNLF
jgi:hypothetical protein